MQIRAQYPNYYNHDQDVLQKFEKQTSKGPTGLPNTDQSKIPCFPCVFNILFVFFQPQNITFILLPLPIERYATINTQFQMQQRLLQKLHSIIGLSPTQRFLQSQKIVAVSHHNPGISLNF